jgi:exo-beta-1,3-glucanase (GH17 family)/isocitrate dehydrogenase
MVMLHQPRLLAVIFAALALLTACGGGSDATRRATGDSAASRATALAAVPDSGVGISTLGVGTASEMLDMDGDGRADLLWTNAASGQTAAWLMDGTLPSQTAAIFSHPDFRVIATPDLDGDGKSDLLWYNAATGETAAWLMNGATVNSAASLLVHAGFKVIATPDLNGDGKSDLLWYNASTGQTAVWLMDGTSVLAVATLLTHPDFKVIATPDLNGDGKSDLVWYSAATGQTAAWLMNGTVPAAIAVLFTHPDFKVVATPDLDGDGKSDLVWYSASSGQTAAWLMNGLAPSAIATLLIHPDFRVIATPDLDGDGRSDLVWYSPATGQTAAWLMNGTSAAGISVLLTHPDFRIVATTDVNGDGRSDLVWSNDASGQTSVWLMNGLSPMGTATLLVHPSYRLAALLDRSPTPAAPVANAGSLASAAVGTTLTLDGRASRSRGGRTLSYAWTLTSRPEGSTAKLVNSRSAQPTLTLDLPGNYVATLVVRDGQSSSHVASVRITGTSAFTLGGLNFSPYPGAQGPDAGTQVSVDQIRQMLSVVSPYTKRVRTFGATNGQQYIAAVAQSMGLAAAAGGWIGRDAVANERELSNLIAIGRSGTASTLIVGSEALLRGDVQESELIEYIQRVKAAVPGVPVAYADTYGQLLGHPAVVAAVDVVFANYYPYWEGVAIDDAMAMLKDRHALLMAASQGKPVVVSEAGWPTAGNTVGQAVPSAANAARFFLAFVSWTREFNIDYYFFEAFDEAWKATPANPQEAHWGLWDSNLQLKPGMQSVFDGQTVADSWFPGGAGAPTVSFTSVPALGSTTPLSGRIVHVNPAAHHLLVYIFVGGQWWIKPLTSNALTNIAFDWNGNWTTSITTDQRPPGSGDSLATEIQAFLLPASYSGPIPFNPLTLPAELFQASVATAHVTR